MATSSALQTSENQDKIVCKICLKQLSLYTCPRCHVRYCSSACYKSSAHAACSENFYKDCFMEGLKDMQSSAGDRQKVLDMLARLEDENPVLDSDDELEDEQVVDLEERLQGIDLDKDTDEVWNRLTEEEREEFKEMLKDGRLGNLVELWEPWWNQKEQGLIQEVSPEHPHTPLYPRIITDIPDIDSLLKSKSPASNIPFSVVNVLYGYAYLARLENGSHPELPQQTVQGVFDLCGTLRGQTFDSAEDSVNACITRLQNQAKHLFVSQEFSVAVLQDVKSLLEGPSPRLPLTYVMAAISDLHHIMTTRRKSISQDLKKVKASTKRATSLKADRQRLFNAIKKLEFLLSWVHKYGLQLASLVPQVDLEFCSLSSDLASHQEHKGRLEAVWGGSRPPRKMNRFIEEIKDT